MKRLPIIRCEDTDYFVDFRLKELRNVEAPWDAIRFCCETEMWFAIRNFLPPR